jgi:hypothetical protein
MAFKGLGSWTDSTSNAYDTLIAKIHADHLARQILYDTLTAHGTIRKTQQEWSDKIHAELDSMSEFASTLEDCMPNVSFEQIAFDFFLEKVFTKEYADQKAIYFPGHTEAQNSLGGPFPRCFPLDKDLVRLFYKSKPAKIGEVKVGPSIRANIKFLEKPKTKTLRIAIFRSVTLNGKKYVHLTLSKVNEFVDHYIIKIIDQRVSDYCKVNEVI